MHKKYYKRWMIKKNKGLIVKLTVFLLFLLTPWVISENFLQEEHYSFNFFFLIAFNKMVSKHYFSKQSQTSQLAFTFLLVVIILLRYLLRISLTYPLPSFFNRNHCLPAFPVSFTTESVLVNGYLHHCDTIYEHCIAGEFTSSKVCSVVSDKVFWMMSDIECIC